MASPNIDFNIQLFGFQPKSVLRANRWLKRGVIILATETLVQSFQVVDTIGSGFCGRVSK